VKHIAALTLIAVVAVEASACSYREMTLPESYRSATSVFRARVTEVRLAMLPAPRGERSETEVVEAKYEIREVFKGKPPADGIVRDMPFGPGNCSLGLFPGMEYVFFPAMHAMVAAPSGSFGFFNAEGSEVMPKLQILRDLAASSAR